MPGQPMQNHGHQDNNRPLILPPHAAPFSALICLIFAAAGDITNAVNKADGRYVRDISRGIISRQKSGRVKIEIGEASPTF